FNGFNFRSLVYRWNQFVTLEYLIRSTTPEDMSRVDELITELAVLEKEPEAVEISVADVKKDGAGAHTLFDCFVAEHKGNVEGIALVYTRYSNWKGEVLHLEDLIVSQHMRGSGLGSALLDKVVQHGYEKGVKRICWEVLDWNEPAIAFYEKKGAEVKRDW